MAARKAHRKTGNPRGAKVGWVVTPEIIEEVKILAGRGLTQQQIHAYYGVSKDTWYSRCNENAELKTAFLQGKSKTISFVAGKLMEHVKKGNLSAIIFYLKTQAGYSDNKCPDCNRRLEDEGAAGGEKSALSLTINDPVEAAKIYQQIMLGS